MIYANMPLNFPFFDCIFCSVFFAGILLSEVTLNALHVDITEAPKEARVLPGFLSDFFVYAGYHVNFLSVLSLLSSILKYFFAICYALL